VHATSTAKIVDRKGGISAPFPNLLSEDEPARQFVNTERKAMNQIEKLKAKLAMASPHEAQTIKALIATLEAAPDATSDAALDTASDPRLRFLNHEQAKFWAPIILGKARCVASPENPVDPLEDPCKRRG
jgi:hypothetical protein